MRPQRDMSDDEIVELVGRYQAGIASEKEQKRLEMLLQEKTYDELVWKGHSPKEAERLAEEATRTVLWEIRQRKFRLEESA